MLTMRFLVLNFDYCKDVEIDMGKVYVYSDICKFAKLINWRVVHL